MKSVKLVRRLHANGCLATFKLTSHKNQSGTAMSEYLIGTAGIALALFFPIPGVNESAFTFMVEALRGFQANTTYIMSLP